MHGLFNGFQLQPRPVHPVIEYSQQWDYPDYVTSSKFELACELSKPCYSEQERQSLVREWFIHNQPEIVFEDWEIRMMRDFYQYSDSPF